VRQAKGIIIEHECIQWVDPTSTTAGVRSMQQYHNRGIF